MKCLNLYFKKLRKAIKNCLSLQGENKIKSRSIVSSDSQIVKKRSNTQRIIYLQSCLKVRPLNFIQMHTARQLSDRTLVYFTKIIGLVYARNNY